MYIYIYIIAYGIYVIAYGIYIKCHMLLVMLYEYIIYDDMLDNAGLKQDVLLYIFNLFVGYSVDLVESVSKHFKCIFLFDSRVSCRSITFHRWCQSDTVFIISW